jgi:hypothetical protein
VKLFGVENKVSRAQKRRWETNILALSDALSLRIDFRFLRRVEDEVLWNVLVDTNRHFKGNTSRLLITLLMEAANSSETLVIITGLHGAASQKS